MSGEVVLSTEHSGKPLGGRDSDPNCVGGAHSASPDPIAPPREPHTPLSGFGPSVLAPNKKSWARPWLSPPSRRFYSCVCLSVCLSVWLLTGLLTNYLTNLYESLCNGLTQPRANRLGFYLFEPKVEVSSGKKGRNRFFLLIPPFKIVVESRHKLKESLIQFSKNSKCDYGRMD